MKIICEHCGSNINVEKDNICPNCKAPYNKNKEYLKKKEEIENLKKNSVEFGKKIAKKVHNTSKIFLIVYAILFLIIISSFIFIFTKIVKQENSITNINHNINEKENNNIDLNYSDVLFLNDLKWNGSILHKAKKGYKFVLINITIKNNTGNKIYINDDNIICNIDGVIQDNISFYIHDYKTLPTSVDNGLIAEGYVGYEVLENANEFDITFNEKTIHIISN